jgi:hypothetical protein
MNVETKHDEFERNATQQCWLASLIAFIAWLFDAITKLKRVKRTTKFKANWRDHFDGLRHSEWHMAQMLAQGAALLLSGKTLDDADYVSLPMPPDFGGPCPRTPYAMNLRFLKLAQFMRDPERYIRRHAARIAKREHISGCPLRHASHATSPVLRTEEENARGARRRLSSSDAQRRGRWIAATSRRDGEGSRRPAFNAGPRAPPLKPDCLLPTAHSLSAQRA